MKLIVLDTTSTNHDNHYRFLTFEPIIKIPIKADNTIFTVITLSNINSFTEVNSIVIQHLQVPLSEIKN